jgi:hypothetical protein
MADYMYPSYARRRTPRASGLRLHQLMMKLAVLTLGRGRTNRKGVQRTDARGRPQWSVVRKVRVGMVGKKRRKGMVGEGKYETCMGREAHGAIFLILSAALVTSSFATDKLSK